MVRLIGIILLTLALAACGSKGGDNLDGSVEVSLLTFSNDGFNYSDSAPHKNSIFNSGDIDSTQMIYRNAVVHNNTPKHFTGFFHMRTALPGCPEAGGAWAGVISTGPGGYDGSGAGGYSGCDTVSLGPAAFTMTIYNGPLPAQGTPEFENPENYYEKITEAILYCDIIN